MRSSVTLVCVSDCSTSHLCDSTTFSAEPNIPMYEDASGRFTLLKDILKEHEHNKHEHSTCLHKGKTKGLVKMDVVRRNKVLRLRYQCTADTHEKFQKYDFFQKMADTAWKQHTHMAYDETGRWSAYAPEKLYWTHCKEGRFGPYWRTRTYKPAQDANESRKIRYITCCYRCVAMFGVPTGSHKDPYKDYPCYSCYDYLIKNWTTRERQQQYAERMKLAACARVKVEIFDSGGNVRCICQEMDLTLSSSTYWVFNVPQEELQDSLKNEYSVQVTLPGRVVVPAQIRPCSDWLALMLLVKCEDIRQCLQDSLDNECGAVVTLPYVPQEGLRDGLDNECEAVVGLPDVTQEGLRDGLDSGAAVTFSRGILSVCHLIELMVKNIQGNAEYERPINVLYVKQNSQGMCEHSWLPFHPDEDMIQVGIIDLPQAKGGAGIILSVQHSTSKKGGSKQFPNLIFSSTMVGCRASGNKWTRPYQEGWW